MDTWFKEILLNYAEVRRNSNNEKKRESTREWSKIITEKIPNYLQSLLGENYSTKGSYGLGIWAYVPWISIFDKEITTSPQKGFYLVYLFKADLSGFYLSFCWGGEYFDKYGFKSDKLNS